MITAMSDTVRDAGFASAILLSAVSFLFSCAVMIRYAILKGRVDDIDDRLHPPLAKSFADAETDPGVKPLVQRPTPYPRTDTAESDMPRQLEQVKLDAERRTSVVEVEYREFAIPGGGKHRFQFRSADDVGTTTAVDRGSSDRGDPEVPGPAAGARPEGRSAMSNGRKLDYVPRLDERNLAHRVLGVPSLADVPRYWTGGAVLDQGREGSCVGHGVVAEWMASPVRGRPVRDNRPGPYFAESGHEEAVKVYNRAKEIDEWEGVNYDGTSVRAGMLVARERGWCTGFRWSLDLVDLRTALEDGPVVIGIEVRESMFNPLPNGDWSVEGDVKGGHCCLITGYSPNYNKRGPRYRIRNSWGADWGKDGNVYISPANLQKILFDAGGEAAVAIGRHL